MVNKINELTEKIYQEGIEKSRKEAKEIIAGATNEADQIVNEANNDAKAIIDKAEKEAVEIKKKVETDLRLAARQFTSQLKQEIADLITAKQVEEPVKLAFDDDEFIRDIIKTLISNWITHNQENADLSVLLPRDMATQYDDFFEETVRKQLNINPEIGYDESLGSGFKVGPKDGRYYISFTDEAFVNYFKKYLKNITKKILFDEPD